ncbi:peroxiredoxin-like 2C isoform X3 [Pseudophryne corroboree]|uniref:peroxiredoxin-like 2C isoform X3 n=1 Tax=Pseudophryne corroboree TaxID=495146 RepID=UPI003082190D
MASESSTPVTQQIGRNMEGGSAELCTSLYHPDLELAAGCLLRDRSGRSFQFGDLYRDSKAIIVFVRNFLCYTCKEYVEDLAKIPKSFLEKADVRLIVIGQSSYLHIQQFCSLTGYPHEMYVNTDRDIYTKLGMKKGETSTSSGNRVHFLHRDMNRYNHVPISSLLRYAGVQTIYFGNKPQILEV